tara:strand:- start:390 stop:1433 length:1044 start_codon:yes stop_codon:yes gene_type:complete
MDYKQKYLKYNMNYKQKYLKYKLKYLNYKKNLLKKSKHKHTGGNYNTTWTVLSWAGFSVLLATVYNLINSYTTDSSHNIQTDKDKISIDGVVGANSLSNLNKLNEELTDEEKITRQYREKEADKERAEQFRENRLAERFKAGIDKKTKAYRILRERKTGERFKAGIDKIKADRKEANEGLFKEPTKKMSTDILVSKFTKSLKDKAVERNRLTKEEQSKLDLTKPLKPMSFKVEQGPEQIIYDTKIEKTPKTLEKISEQELEEIDSGITETIENFEVNNVILKKIVIEYRLLNKEITESFRKYRRNKTIENRQDLENVLTKNIPTPKELENLKNNLDKKKELYRKYLK